MGSKVALYAKQIKKDGRDPKDAEALGNFAYIGFLNFDRTPKPAMEVWDSFGK